MGDVSVVEIVELGSESEVSCIEVPDDSLDNLHDGSFYLIDKDPDFSFLRRQKENNRKRKSDESTKVVIPEKQIKLNENNENEGKQRKKRRRQRNKGDKKDSLKTWLQEMDEQTDKEKDVSPLRSHCTTSLNEETKEEAVKPGVVEGEKNTKVNEKATGVVCIDLDSDDDTVIVLSDHENNTDVKRKKKRKRNVENIKHKEKKKEVVKKSSCPLRPVIIDGCNVAFGHGKDRFSSEGLEKCIEWFEKRGHKVTAFVPQFRRAHGLTTNPSILDQLEKRGALVFTPSRFIPGQGMVVPYDDRYIVKYASEVGGVIVSRDNFRDIMTEDPKWSETVSKRLLMYTWVQDTIMFPEDPLGQFGPNLDDFLRFDPPDDDKSEQGKKKVDNITTAKTNRFVMPDGKSRGTGFISLNGIQNGIKNPK